MAAICLQVISTAQEPQDVKTAERRGNTNYGLHEPQACRKQGKVLIDSLEKHVESCEECGIA